MSDIAPEYKRLGNVNKGQVRALLTRFLDCNLKELKDIKSDPESSAMELIVVSIVTNAIKSGDQKRLDFLLDRIVGKVKDELEVSMTPHDRLMTMIEGRIEKQNDSKKAK